MEGGYVGNGEVHRAQTQVDEDRPLRGADEEGPDADREPAVLVEVGGVRGPALRLAGREQDRGIEPAVPVGQVGEGRVAHVDLGSLGGEDHDCSWNRRGGPVPPSYSLSGGYSPMGS